MASTGRWVSRFVILVVATGFASLYGDELGWALVVGIVLAALGVGEAFRLLRR